MTKHVIDVHRRMNIEKLVVGQEKMNGVVISGKLLAGLTKNIIAEKCRICIMKSVTRA
jgi:hypothetical protein